MRHEPLSLFDTRPTRSQRLTACGISIALFLNLVVLLAMGDRPLPALPTLVPVFEAVLLLADLVIATLLLAQASVFRSRALLALGGAFLFTALMIIPHMLSFPGAFSPTGLFGANPDIAAWTFCFWRAGFPLGILVYAVLKRANAKGAEELRCPRSATFLACLCAAGMALALSALAIRSDLVLPHLMKDQTTFDYPHVAIVDSVLLGFCIIAIFMLVRLERSLLDLWLLVGLVAWLIRLMMTGATSGRFTMIWYAAQIEGLVPRLVVMFALLAEAHRIYARLVVARLAQQREREGRVLSMDAVAAAISHEIRQPLAAMVANAGAALHWLDRLGPPSEEIARPLRSIVADGHRAAGIVESVRDMFAERRGERVALDMNALVRETASLMASEFALQHVSLRLDLEDRLPVIVADRIQIGQVLLNLFANSVEALAETEGRERRLAVRSARGEGESVLVEVSDCGTGFPPDEANLLFEPFFTTKQKGVGVGLSLCRSIVESHGGRLWVSRGERFGATFHFQLPQPRLAA